MTNQTKWASLSWRDDKTPIADQFDDPYFSLDNGLAETRYVFLSGNDLPNQFRPNFHIGELGFGTGLNFLTTLKAWRDTDQSGRLYFTSFEAFPMHADDIEKALAHFPEISGLKDDYLMPYRDGARRIETDDFTLEIVLGDARQTLPRWNQKAHAWYLDGFSPAKNQELWGEALMKSVFDHTHTAGSFATYSAAGLVKRGLSDAGFSVERIEGFGRKRHMLVGTKP